MKQTTLCYLERGNQYLMLHRVKKENDASHDKWIGVGGKCEKDESPDEPGESPEDCVLREVKEETGLDVLQWRYRGIVTFISDVWPCEYMHLFTASDWSGEEIVCNEGDLQWIEKQRLFDLTNKIKRPSYKKLFTSFSGFPHRVFYRFFVIMFNNAANLIL